MKALSFQERLMRSVQNRKDIWIEQYPLHYQQGNYELIRMASKRISKKDKVVLITAGLHGEERAGPLTFLHFANEIMDFIEKQNLKFILYPLCNPSGFEHGTRHPIDDPNDDWDTNAFVRYQLENGKWVDDLGNRKSYRKWAFTMDEFRKDLPPEAKLLKKLLKKDLQYKIVTALDLHQDYISSGQRVGAYQYKFGSTKKYGKIAERIQKIVPLIGNRKINAGYDNGIAAKSDSKGFIERWDGTLSDWLHHFRIPNVLTIETMGKTPLNKAMKVNLEWIYGVAELAK